MGLTKEYLRYAPAGNYNIIASRNCNIKFVTLEGQEGRYVAAGACEHIIIWDLRLGEKALVLSGEKAEVTCLCASGNGRHLAAGYNDGTIQIYDLRSGDVVSVFAGHKYEITTLAYDTFGHKLASSSKDTDIIVWDTVAETGICRLSGHKGVVTQLTFMSDDNVLASSSKDGLVKLWDLNTQHCFKTIVGHRSEVWAICSAKNGRYLITGCGDAELRVWKVFREGESIAQDLTSRLENTDITDEDDYRYPLRFVKAGCLLRSGRGRVVSMNIDSTGQILMCHGTDNQVELFQFCPDEEVTTRFRKRLKKERKKAKESTDKANDPTEQQLDSSSSSPTLRDEVRRLPCIKLNDKPKAIDIVTGGGGEVRVAISLANNILELYNLHKIENSTGAKVTESDYQLLRSVHAQGHRGEVRAIAFSSDNLAVVSAGADGIKLWNRSSQICLRTITMTKKSEAASDENHENSNCYVVSVCFVPGDRHVLAGLKDGRLLIVDISAGDVLEEIPAHGDKEIWSVVVQPDLRGCVTGGGDKTCKWWNFELIVDENSPSKAKVLSLLHTRTLALEDVVLCVKLTPNERFVAVALLDSTVKIFFADSFKLHVSLYGHKLPVLSMTISHDSRLIVTGSADRNIKIWGLDFGDCHKSLFAHDDSVTGLEFVPKTHLFFSCGKDGNVRQWDADSFQRITTLPTHKGEAWCITVSPDGRHVVSCGSDRVIRSLLRTEEPLVLEDEREEERERAEAEQLATGDGKTIVGGQTITLPTRKTVGSERAADSILECLEICNGYREQLAEHAALQAASERPVPLPVAPPLMQAYSVKTPEDFVFETLKRIRTSELEETLLLLPFSSACELLQVIPALLERGDNTELICRVLLFLLKVHHAPFVANQTMLPMLKKIQKQATDKVTEFRDVVGYNLHGMQYMQREIEAAEGVQLFRDASRNKKTKDKKRKQRETLKRSVMVLNT